LFASERQNVINGTTHIRQSPLISPKVPVHGLMLDIETGRLDWLVNGYEQLAAPVSHTTPLQHKIEQAKEALGALSQLRAEERKWREVKIGAMPLDPSRWLSDLHLGHGEPPKAAEGAPEEPQPKPTPPIPKKGPPPVPPRLAK